VESLPAAEREGAEAQQLLAGCYTERGWLNEGPRPADAERDQARALDLFERLARARPDDPERQDALARAEHMLADVLAYKRAGRAEEAERHYARVIAIRKALVRDHPANENFQRELAEDYYSRSPMDLARGHRAEAIADCANAEKLLRPLVARHPEDAPCAVALAGTYVNWGHALASAGPAQGALAWLSQAVELAEALARVNQAVELAEAALRRLPDFAEARLRVLEAHGERAEVNERLGRYAEAVKDWDRVVEMDAVPKQWTYRGWRAAALAAAGEHARATAEAGALEAAPAVSADGRWELARVYAQSIPLARSDAKLSMAERNALTERYAAAAVALLQKLGRQGYFKDPTHARWLNTDSAWQPLRSREDFRRLRAGLKSK
jgi:tetratricopeptide (TPR) repeat protein